jgi:amidase
MHAASDPDSEGSAVDLASTTASEALQLLRAGQVSSEELLDLQLAKIEQHNVRLNLVVALDERARGRCRAADTVRARRRVLGPLHGLPITVKDTFETEGLVTTAGAPELATHVPTQDAIAVAQLRAAGAIVLGKTNTPRFGGDVQTYNDLHGLSRNPWDPSRTVGGSSGGAAGALAVGMTLLELGSDIAGSIRVPAHYTGVCGHRPTWGAVSTRGHIPGLPGSRAPVDLGVAGPLARTVGDLRTAMDVLAVDVGGIPGARLPAITTPPTSLADLRVAVLVDDPAAPTERETRTVLRAVADALADEGAAVTEDRPAGVCLEECFDLYLRLLASATSDPTARHITHTAWLRADEQRHRIADAWDRFFAESSVDVVITPTAPSAAFLHDVDRPVRERSLTIDGMTVPYLRHLAWAGLATLPNLPATAVPAGMTAHGLPVGLQIVGARWADRTTLAAASLIEGTRGGFRPPVAPGSP